MEYFNIENFRSGGRSGGGRGSGSYGRSGGRGASYGRSGGRGASYGRSGGRSSSRGSSIRSSSRGSSISSSRRSSSSRSSSSRTNNSPVIPKISGGSFRPSFNYSSPIIKHVVPKYTHKQKPKPSPKPFDNKYSPNLYTQTSTTNTMGYTGGALGFGWGYDNLYPIEVIPYEAISINEYDEKIKKFKIKKLKKQLEKK